MLLWLSTICVIVTVVPLSNIIIMRYVILRVRLGRMFRIMVLLVWHVLYYVRLVMVMRPIVPAVVIVIIIIIAVSHNVLLGIMAHLISPVLSVLLLQVHYVINHLISQLRCLFKISSMWFLSNSIKMSAFKNNYKIF